MATNWCLCRHRTAAFRLRFFGSQRPRTPVRGCRRQALQRLGDSLLHHCIRNLARRAGTRIVRQTLHALHPVALPPFANRGAGHAQLQSDGLIAKSFGCPKHDLRAHCHALGGLGTTRQQRQFLLINGIQHQRLLRTSSSHLASRQTLPEPRIKEDHYFCNESLTHNTS